MAERASGSMGGKGIWREYSVENEVKFQCRAQHQHTTTTPTASAAALANPVNEM